MLAIAVVTAVIFFGALISAGNERQRKAIEALREQVVLWAIQDLRVKREKLAPDVRIDNPADWLNRISRKICAQDLNLEIGETFDSPPAILCSAGNIGGKVVFSPLSPDEIRAIKRSKFSRLRLSADYNPLLCLPRGVRTYEISVLNGGLLFDFEISLVWRGLTGQKRESLERIWMYIFRD